MPCEITRSLHCCVTYLTLTTTFMENTRFALPAAPPSPGSTFLGYKSNPPSLNPPRIKLGSRPALTPPTPRKKARVAKHIPGHRGPNAGASRKRAGTTVTTQTVNDTEIINGNEWSSGMDDWASIQHTPATPTSRLSVPNKTQNYELYVDAVLAGDAEFTQISPEFFVVQGWDARNILSTVRFA